MLSKDAMEKARAYPGRYGEYFYSGIFVSSLRLNTKKNLLI